MNTRDTTSLLLYHLILFLLISFLLIYLNKFLFIFPYDLVKILLNKIPFIRYLKFC